MVVPRRCIRLRLKLSASGARRGDLARCADEHPLEIRPLRAEDRAGWEPLWQGYLRFYREQLPAEVTDHAFARLTEQRDGMFGLAAVADGRLVGFSHAIVHPSTWSTTSYCYLEDLFVDPGTRGTDAGRALIEATAAAGASAAPTSSTGRRSSSTAAPGRSTTPSRR